MFLSAIVAMSENRVIGKDNRLPWHLPADLIYFKKTTINKPILMGRKTYESIGRPLPQRKNIIITRDQNFIAPGCQVFNSIDVALASLAEQEEVLIIGGATLYQQMLPRMQRIYLTIIHQQFEGDAFFPEFNMQEWREIERSDHEPDEKNKYPYSFTILDRI